MPSLQSNLSSKHSFDETGWIIHIRQTLEEPEDNTNRPVSIFNVPKSLMAVKPEAFTPQLLAIGPYHPWRPELYEMERYKLSAARRIQRQLHTGLKYQNIVDRLVKHENKIRASYHRYIDLNGETLAWMMAVDACFLLEFLQIYAVQDGTILTRISSRMSHLVDHSGRKSAHNTMLKDIMMLENQIPIFVLRKLLDFLHGSKADEILSMILIGLYREISPFKMVEGLDFQSREFDFKQRSHILEFLYYLLVPKNEEQPEIIEQDDQNENSKEETETISNDGPIKQLFNIIWSFLTSLNLKPIYYIKALFGSRFIQCFVKLPWKIISNVPGLSLLAKPIENLFFSSNEKESGEVEEVKSKTPLIEEISIPSVTELWNAGVKFCATSGDLTTINFDAKTVTLYLRTITLDVNTEVILRNLVAYEACAAPGALVFTRYVEFMNGIIDTEEDVKLLRNNGIILNHLKTDGEVANMWNSMSQSVKLTKVEFLDKVIADVNKYYSSTWKVKTGKFMKRYVFGSWQFLTFLAAIILLLMTTLQAFCSVYNCSRWFSVKGLNS